MAWRHVSCLSSLLFFATLLAAFVELCNAGKTSTFIRKKYPSTDLPFDADVFAEPPGHNAPQQVHITQGNHDGRAMIVSWVYPFKGGSKRVHYHNEKTGEKKHANAIVVKYKWYNYTSGYIHHCTIKNLEYDTKYYYTIGGGDTRRTFSFVTPPEPGPDVPYTFGLIGDLGQTVDSNRTLTHYEHNPYKGKAVLMIGDLSYADDHPYHNNERWDSWGRFVERSVAYQPWIWVAGNHEIDFAPELGENEPFVPYLHRYHVPFEDSGSTSPLWYSIKRASAYIIVLSSYSACAKYTPQYDWLQQELPKVNRTETPWLIVLVHSPWYNSYNYHYMEGESMRVVFEQWMVQYKVDLVLAGHVHAYERSGRISNIRYNITDGLSVPTSDNGAPVYITIGDGGNIEGLAFSMTTPQPEYSVYREASYGHGIFDIKNRTHAYFSWNRNEDQYSTEADSKWFHNRFWYAHVQESD
ncbi:hypothetical protein MLD38_013863 [Melastoma candidum]|uniref:Uncharacterized protein n=1 Tax=Melastoma candidum TaxID=119954 RepID=A0ACB9REL6_9MYRT|nr:hypothetical protein MLD38_013863 [Melastoma candidum]